MWVEKYRPHTLEDIILPDATRKVIDEYVAAGRIKQNLFLCSRPGQGKTSLAKLLAYDVFKVDTLYVNASAENDIETMRSKITDFAHTLPLSGDFKVIILDEADNFASKGAQKVLRALMEDTADNTRFILTANYAADVIEPVKSRCVQLDINPPKKAVLTRALNILAREGYRCSKDDIVKVLGLVNAFYPDVRSVIKHLQLSLVEKDGVKVLEIADFKVDKTLCEEIYSMVSEKKATELRKFLIANEARFNGDYHSLLSDFLRMVMADETIEEAVRIDWCITIVDYLNQFGNLTDPELLAAACFWRLIKGLR